jgi:hypothetical protein
MQNFLDPAILFFVFGIVAGLLKSDLEVPPTIAKFISMYLLMAIGLKGGFALAASGFTAELGASLFAAVLMATLIPALGYQFLKTRVSKFDAAAIAASYGSVSAVTFVTAMQVLESHQLPFGGHMTVAMVVMESPAILMAVMLANRLRYASASGVVSAGAGQAALLANPGAFESIPLKKIVHESFTSGSHLLLLGSLSIGFLSAESGKAVMQPFVVDLFKGLLAFFLLDMGLTVAKNTGSLRKMPIVLWLYALGAPLLHATIALLLAATLGMAMADAILLMVLSASASYIVVPAVLRYAIPEAQASLYCGLALGITFPFNMLCGIPLYIFMAQQMFS